MFRLVARFSLHKCVLDSGEKNQELLYFLTLRFPTGLPREGSGLELKDTLWCLGAPGSSADTREKGAGPSRGLLTSERRVGQGGGPVSLEMEEKPRRPEASAVASVLFPTRASHMALGDFGPAPGATWPSATPELLGSRVWGVEGGLPRTSGLREQIKRHTCHPCGQRSPAPLTYRPELVTDRDISSRACGRTRTGHPRT